MMFSVWYWSSTEANYLWFYSSKLRVVYATVFLFKVIKHTNVLLMDSKIKSYISYDSETLVLTIMLSM